MSRNLTRVARVVACAVAFASPAALADDAPAPAAPADAPVAAPSTPVPAAPSTPAPAGPPVAPSTPAPANPVPAPAPPPSETPAPAPSTAPADAAASTPAASPTDAPADDSAADASGPAPPDATDQGVAATLGLAAGGRTTAGGLAIGGHYLYQMSDEDWFDGTATFTFGSGAAACFRDRDAELLCQHGLVDGASAEIAANVRHYLGGRGEFWPYVRLGVGVGIVRYSDDDLTGFTIPMHAGAGFRVSVADGVAVIAEAALQIGIARFSRSLGVEPQLGASVMGGAEFRL